MAGMDNFTQRAQKVLSLAHQEAERSRHSTIGTEHLLLALIVEDGGVAGRVLRELGFEIERVREMVDRFSPPGSSSKTNVGLSADTQQVLETALIEARRMGNQYVSTEHILLALVRIECTALEILGKMGVTPEQIRRSSTVRLTP